MTYRIKLRRDTAANWTQANPILAGGEPGLETDTGRIKYGDGVTTWKLLAYSNTNPWGNREVNITVGDTTHWFNQVSSGDHPIYSPITRYDSEGNVFLAVGYNDNNGDGYLTKYTAGGAVVWSKQLDSTNIVDMTVDRDDNVVLTINYDGDVAVIKLNGTNATEIWAKELDSDWYDQDGYVAVDRENNIIIEFWNNSNDGDSAIILEKLSGDNGSLLWTKRIAPENSYNDMYSLGLDTDGNNNVYIVASYPDDGTEDWNTYIAKFNKSGSLIWNQTLKPFETGYRITDGDVVVDDIGNLTVSVVFGVKSQGPAVGTFNGSAVGVIRLNSVGEQQWVRRVGPGPCDSTLSGIACDNAGNSYIAAAMWQPPKFENYFETEYAWWNSQKNYFALAKYDANGVVVWQRYLEYANGPLWNSQGENYVMMAVRGETLLVSGGMNYLKDQNNRVGQDGVFIGQLPTDGTEMEMGPWKVYESRIPGRLTNKIGINDNPAHTFVINDVTADAIVNPFNDYTISEAQLGHELTASETYNFKFDSRGSLVIPNDGEIRLTQSQIGFFNVIGWADNTNGNVYGKTVVADGEGNSYVGGYNDMDGAGFIAKFGLEGKKLWSTNLWSDNYNGYTDVLSLRLEDEHVIATGTFYDYNSGVGSGFVSYHDIDTGREIPGWSVSISDNGIDPGDMNLKDSVGHQDANFSVGEKQSSFEETGTTSGLTGSGVNVLVVDIADATQSNGNKVNTNWYISGTGISGNSIGINNINYFAGLTATTREGSGAIFDITSDGSAYTVVNVLDGGSNYLVGHKINIPYTLFSAGDSRYDVIVTVTGVDAGVITSATAQANALMNGAATYNAVSGANYDVGSGYQLDIEYYTQSNYTGGDWGTSAGGTNYVVGDVLTISGTQLGGTSPANDLTVTVTSTTGVGNAVYQYSIDGTAQTATVKITTWNNEVDFSQAGEWTIWAPTNTDGFFMLDTEGGFSKTFQYGDPNYSEYVESVAKDALGFAYVVGTTRNPTYANDTGTQDIAYLAKFNMTTGAHVWTKVLNNSGYCYGTNVTVRDNTIVTVHYDDDNYYDPILTKLDLDGNIAWQRRLGNDYGASAIDANGDIYVVTTGYVDLAQGYFIYKINSAGAVQWRRGLEGNEYSYLDDVYRNMTIDDTHVYLTGNTYVPSDYSYNGFIAKLPKDGSGTGYHQYWNYIVNDADWGNQTFDIVDITGWGYTGDDISQYFVSADSPIDYGDLLIYGDWMQTTQEALDVIRDTDGGKIIYADGTTQDTTGQYVPQRITTGGDYLISAEDNGRHILCTYTNTYHNIYIPLDRNCALPIGAVITIVNDSNNSIYIYGTNAHEDDFNIVIPGNGTGYGAYMDSYTIATVIKVGVNRWYLTGNSVGWD